MDDNASDIDSDDDTDVHIDSYVYSIYIYIVKCHPSIFVHHPVYTHHVCVVACPFLLLMCMRTLYAGARPRALSIS